MYVTVKSSDPAKVAFNVASMASMARWKIRVTQILCTDTANLAPAGCVTYDTMDSGNIVSYNYDSGSGALINNQKFCHCIKYTDNMCDISLSATGFDLGADDSLTFGNNVQSGTAFGSSGMLNCEYPWLRREDRQCIIMKSFLRELHRSLLCSGRVWK